MERVVEALSGTKQRAFKRHILKYVIAREQEGGTRYYFRRRGSKTVRLPDDMNSPEFKEQYELALQGKLRKPGLAKKVPEAYRLVDIPCLFGPPHGLPS